MPKLKVVASTDEYTIHQRRDGRYAITNAAKQAVNGDAKVEILLKHELIKAAPPPAPEPEPAPEESTDAAAEEAEAPAEEASDDGAEDATDG